MVGIITTSITVSTVSRWRDLAALMVGIGPALKCQSNKVMLSSKKLVKILSSRMGIKQKVYVLYGKYSLCITCVQTAVHLGHIISALGVFSALGGTSIIALWVFSALKVYDDLFGEDIMSALGGGGFRALGGISWVMTSYWSYNDAVNKFWIQYKTSR